MNNKIKKLVPKELIDKLQLETDSFIYKSKRIQLYKFGTGKNVILSFPAFPHSGLIYANFLQHYDIKDITFITFDLPGWIGFSENIFTHDFDFDELMGIVDKIVAHYNLQRFSTVGFSFGTSLTLQTAIKYKENIERVVLVSPVLDGLIASLHPKKIQINFATKLRLFPLIKAHVLRRFKLYRPIFKREGLSDEFLDTYLDLIKNSSAKIILQSIHHLFNTDYTEDIKHLNDRNLLVANSKDEDKYLREQSEHIRRILKHETSLYIHGNHEDFILHPRTQVVKDVMGFLIK